MALAGRGSAADQRLWKRTIGCHTHSSRHLFLNPNSVLCAELLKILVRTFREKEREIFFVFGCRYRLRGPSCLFMCQTFELNLNSVLATSGSFFSSIYHNDAFLLEKLEIRVESSANFRIVSFCIESIFGWVSSLPFSYLVIWFNSVCVRESITSLQLLTARNQDLILGGPEYFWFYIAAESVADSSKQISFV